MNPESKKLEIEEFGIVEFGIEILSIEEFGIVEFGINHFSTIFRFTKLSQRVIYQTCLDQAAKEFHSSAVQTYCQASLPYSVANWAYWNKNSLKK